MFYSELFSHCFSSLIRVFIGWIIAAILGVVLGTLRARLPLNVRNNFMFNFLIEIPKFPPPIAWIPFIILAFGVSEIGAYTIVFIGAFPSIFTSTYEASINLPKSLTRFADSLGMPPLQRQLNITLRYIAPQLFTSFKVSSAMAWMCVIAAEMISGQSGLGYAIQLSRLNMQYQEVIIYMLAIGVIGFLIHWSLGLLERVILPWSQKGKS